MAKPVVPALPVMATLGFAIRVAWAGMTEVTNDQPHDARVVSLAETPAQRRVKWSYYIGIAARRGLGVPRSTFL